MLNINGFMIVVKMGDTESFLTSVYTDESEAAQTATAMNERYGQFSTTPNPYRVARVQVTELPDDIDADNERTMERIETADEMENANSYLDHPGTRQPIAEFDYLDHPALD